MAIKINDLLGFIKTTDLIVLKVEDDSSQDTQMKILHLQNEVVAVGSNTLPDGSMMRMKTKTVLIAADNIDEFMKDAEFEGDGDNRVLIYKGQMHLDISKPKTRTDATSGSTIVTQPPRVFLTKVKFNRAGIKLRQNQVDGNRAALLTFFGGNKIAEVGTEDLGKVVEVKQTVTDLTPNGEQKKAEPEPVALETGGGPKVVKTGNK